MNNAEVKKMFKFISEVYDDFYTSEEKVNIWASVLSEITIEQARKAMMIIVKTDTKAPVPARILQVINEEKKLETNMAEPPSIIWERVIGLAAKGERGEQIFNQSESERTKRAVRSVGGFERLRLAEIDVLPFLRKDFITNYSEITVYEDTKQINQEVNKLIGCISESKTIEKEVMPVFVEGRVRW